MTPKDSECQESESMRLRNRKIFDYLTVPVLPWALLSCAPQAYLFEPAMPSSTSGKTPAPSNAPDPPPGVDLPADYVPKRCRRCGSLVFFFWGGGESRVGGGPNPGYRIVLETEGAQSSVQHCLDLRHCV